MRTSPVGHLSTERRALLVDRVEHINRVRTCATALVYPTCMPPAASAAFCGLWRGRSGRWIMPFLHVVSDAAFGL
jgi:hypothetical protein